MQVHHKDTNIWALLGPTNTGKTYFAMERLLAHGSGMIGFPLRLLARENYDRAVEFKGTRQVALITGEEKIIPVHAKYFFCTIESMPVSKKVDFLAIDEIQMCSDPARGHIFTSRLLHARGHQETMFMGSGAIRPLLKQLVPGIKFKTRPRFSKLRYAGSRKVIHLPPRSAVVAFSSADVYAFAELIRRQRGGAAIVMGALSPRTRNAQVAMFQNGDVDYLVATDAIGMGLNMDVNHIAFASLNKFDGSYRRNLQLSEFAQIAGRAGRHMKNGTFGITGEAKEFDLSLIEQIENHHYDVIRNIQWRNPAINCHSFDSLIESLNANPEMLGLVKARQSNDEKFLIELAADEDIRNRLSDSSSVQLLWAVCQIPNFRNQISSGHVGLLSHIFKSLNDLGKLSSEWIMKEVNSIDDIDGGIDLLVDRIANIRIWTYISNQSHWLADSEVWQQRTRAIEDRLSDALHERLTQRFVDQRTSFLVKKLEEKKVLQSTVNFDGEILVENHFVGRIEGFKFIPATTDSFLAGRTISAAAHKTMIKEAQRRVIDIMGAPDLEFNINSQGKIFWLKLGKKHSIAYLAAGADFLKPHIKVLSSGLLDATMKSKVEKRLYDWLNYYIKYNLKPLIKARDSKLTGALRGLIFQLVENGGVINKRQAVKQLNVLQEKDYSMLRRLGIKIGRRDIFLPKLIRPKAAGLSALLWAIKNKINPVPELPNFGSVSFAYSSPTSIDFMRVAGYRKAGNLFVRIDIFERLLGILKLRTVKGSFELDPKILNLLGCNKEQGVRVLKSIGYHKKSVLKTDPRAEKLFFVGPKSQQTNFNKKKRAKPSNSEKRHVRQAILLVEESPFAKLKEMSIR